MKKNKCPASQPHGAKKTGDTLHYMKFNRFFLDGILSQNIMLKKEFNFLSCSFTSKNYKAPLQQASFTHSQAKQQIFCLQITQEAIY